MQPVTEDAFDHNSGQLMTDLTDSTVLIKARVEYSDLEVYGELVPDKKNFALFGQKMKI